MPVICSLHVNVALSSASVRLWLCVNVNERAKIKNTADQKEYKSSNHICQKTSGSSPRLLGTDKTKAELSARFESCYIWLQANTILLKNKQTSDVVVRWYDLKQAVHVCKPSRKDVWPKFPPQWYETLPFICLIAKCDCASVAQPFIGFRRLLLCRFGAGNFGWSETC